MKNVGVVKIYHINLLLIVIIYDKIIVFANLFI